MFPRHTCFFILEVVSPNQHNIIFDHLAPVLQQILKSLKNVLTTPGQRAKVESFPIYHIKEPQGDLRSWD